MPATESSWSSPDKDESVAALINLAKDDWTDICALIGEVGRRYGRDVSVREAGRPRVFRIAVMGVDYAAICRLRYSSWTSCGVL